MARVTTFYGSCDRCGRGMVARVESLTDDMCGPSLVMVCQHHLPVGEGKLVNAHGLGAEERTQWAEWEAKAIVDG